MDAQLATGMMAKICWSNTIMRADAIARQLPLLKSITDSVRPSATGKPIYCAQICADKVWVTYARDVTEEVPADTFFMVTFMEYGE